MTIHLSLPYNDQKDLSGKTSALKSFCNLFQVEIRKEGKLHYPDEFVLGLPDDTYLACLQINAIQAYCQIHQIPSSFYDE